MSAQPDTSRRPGSRRARRHLRRGAETAHQRRAPRKRFVVRASWKRALGHPAIVAGRQGHRDIFENGRDAANLSSSSWRRERVSSKHRHPRTTDRSGRLGHESTRNRRRDQDAETGQSKRSAPPDSRRRRLRKCGTSGHWTVCGQLGITRTSKPIGSNRRRAAKPAAVNT